LIVNEQGLTISLAILSLVLRLGWYKFERNQTNNLFRQLVAVPWVRGAAIFFYFAGIPYLALIFGLLTPRLLGLKGLEYFALIDWNGDFLAAQIQQATTLMLLEWLLDSSVIILAGLAAILILIAIRISLTHQGVVLTLTRETTLFTIYYGLHWAFYRAIFWSLTGDLYLGVVLGLGFVLLEWSLTSWVQGQWLESKQCFLVNTIILILTSTLFFYSPNLWLLWPIHLLLVAIINGRWRVIALARIPDR